MMKTPMLNKVVHYSAKTGYDNVTGIGSPIGEALAGDPDL
jgi:hypothetical protein